MLLNNNQINIIKTILKARYKRLVLIGRGSYSIIFDIGNDKAMKVFFESDEDHKSITEIDILKTLHHDNIIKLYEYGKLKNYDYAIMEYVKGFNFYELLQWNNLTDSKIPEVVIKAILKQLANCIEYLHHNRILHRDIKNTNFVVNNKGIIKLVDFGVAIKIDTDPIISEAYNFTFEAPETTLKKKVYFKSEVWSLGSCIYQLMTGIYKRGLFNEDNYSYEVKNKVIDFNLSCSNELIQILKGMIQRDINKRLDSTELKKQTQNFDIEPLKIYASYLMRSKAFTKYLDYIRNAELYKVLHLGKFLNQWKAETK